MMITQAYAHETPYPHVHPHSHVGAYADALLTLTFFLLVARRLRRQ